MRKIVATLGLATALIAGPLAATAPANAATSTADTTTTTTAAAAETSRTALAPRFIGYYGSSLSCNVAGGAGKLLGRWNYWVCEYDYYYDGWGLWVSE